MCSHILNINNTNKLDLHVDLNPSSHRFHPRDCKFHTDNLRRPAKRAVVKGCRGPCWLKYMYDEAIASNVNVCHIVRLGFKLRK
ncbi:hypothetical protein DPMN_012441, partial [Dreissena polymorpha]